MRIFPFFILIISLQAFAQAPDFSWVISSKSTIQARLKAISIDSQRNIYTTGCWIGTNDFDPTNSTISYTSGGDYDSFIQKIDTNGYSIWVKTFTSSSSVRAISITTDSEDNVIICGDFWGTVDFDPGPNTFILNTNGQSDAFVLKLDSNGNLIWAKSFGGNALDNPYALEVDVLGNVYVTGEFSSGTVDFDPGPGNYPLNSYYSGSVFILKLNKNGDFVWAKNVVGGAYFNRGTAITLDRESNVYVTGYFEGSATFNTNTTVASLGGQDIFVEKLDSAGNFVWVKAFGGAYDDFGSGIKTDNDGYVYATGFFRISIDADPGPGTYDLFAQGNYDYYLIKLDSLGSFVWANSYGGYGSDYCFGIDVNANSEIFLTGGYWGDFDIVSDTNTFSLNTNGQSDVFVQKIDSSGQTNWINTYGYNLLDGGRAVATDSVGNVYIGGEFGNWVNFDPGASEYSLYGQTDYFLLRLGWEADPWLPPSSFEINIYPNPTSDFLHINQNGNNLLQIRIFDLCGKNISNIDLNNMTGVIDLRSLSAGNYFIYINDGVSNIKFKVLKL